MGKKERGTTPPPPPPPPHIFLEGKSEVEGKTMINEEVVVVAAEEE